MLTKAEAQRVWSDVMDEITYDKIVDGQDAEIKRLRSALEWIARRDPRITRKTDYTDLNPRHFYEVAYDATMCARSALNIES